MYETREQWLEAATDKLRPVFATRGYQYGEIGVSCSFPSRKALSQKTRAIGQCFDTSASSAGRNEVFISPLLPRDDTDAAAIELLATLVHELIHAAVGVACGHRAPFKQACDALLLGGKPTATVPTPDFEEQIARPILRTLGRYPHPKFDPAADKTIKKQTTRLLKVCCPECGYTARVTRSWLDDAGAPICPADNTQMIEG